jgi:hypothetical protein
MANTGGVKMATGDAVQGGVLWCVAVHVLELWPEQNRTRIRLVRFQQISEIAEAKKKDNRAEL